MENSIGKFDGSTLISIIIPTYNAERFILNTINSIKAQTYENWEIIVIDDCSSDNTLQIVKGQQVIDRRIRIIKLKKTVALRSLGIQVLTVQKENILLS